MKYKLTAIAIAALLTACGGGGGGDGGTATGSATVTGATGTPVAGASDNAAGNLLTSIPSATYAADSTEGIMFAILNTLRKDGGFGMLPQNSLLDLAASNHAKFIANNYLDAEGIPLSSMHDLQPNGWLKAHTEEIGGPGFTGVLPLDRAKSVGYAGRYLGEDIAFNYFAPQNMGTENELIKKISVQMFEGLLGSNGHRASLLDAGMVEVGFGSLKTGIFPSISGKYLPSQTAISVLEPSLGLVSGIARLAPAGWTGVYPVEKSIDIKTGNSYGGGMAASIHFDNTSTMSVSSFTMKKVSDGSLVPGTIDTTIRRYQAYFTPTAVLEPLTQYEANFQGSEVTSVAGRSSRNVSKLWRFTTR